jgi:hypothetical protein
MGHACILSLLHTYTETSATFLDIPFRAALIGKRNFIQAVLTMAIHAYSESLLSKRQP